VSNKSSRAALLENANWVRDEEDHVVFRLTPARAALLFGPFVEAIQGALVAESCGITKQYEMLGNMVSPEVARRLGVSVRDVLF